MGEILNSACRRAKANGLPYTLTRADIPALPLVCPVLGIPLERRTGVGGRRRRSPTLDRIIPELGYIPGNVRWVSHRYNSLRSDMTVNEAEWLLADLRVIFQSVQKAA